MLQRCLVIGGSDENPYGEEFFEVGGHTRADYGAGMDWQDPSFWYGFWQTMANRRFACAFFDRGSESWFYGMSQECMEAFAFAIAQLCPRVLIEGQIVMDGFDGMRPMVTLRRILEGQQDYRPKAFFRIERNAIVFVYCHANNDPQLDGQILPIDELPQDTVPSVTVMPYRELTLLKDIVVQKLL